MLYLSCCSQVVTTRRSFLYGGSTPFLTETLTDGQMTGNVDLDEVWVFSLPAFVWFKADYMPQNARSGHTCNVVGNRQMLSVGGLDPNDQQAGPSQDPLAQGLGVFDLTEMAWTSGYDANAASYQSPKVVKDWYNAK